MGPHQEDGTAERLAHGAAQEVDERADQGEDRVEHEAGQHDEQSGDTPQHQEDEVGDEEPDPRERPQDLTDRLRALVAFHGADHALEHAAVEGKAQRRRAVDEREGHRLETEILDGELSEDRPLEPVEGEDDDGRNHDAGGLRAQRAARHGQELERMQLVTGGTVAGRHGTRHTGMNPSPTKSNRRRPGSKVVVSPSYR